MVSASSWPQPPDPDTTEPAHPPAHAHHPSLPTALPFPAPAAPDTDTPANATTATVATDIGIDTPAPQARPHRRRDRILKKLGFIGVAVKLLFTFATKIKFLGAGLSMIISVAAYALLWGWTFAVGFVLLIFVHEMGHVLQLRREGIPASAPYFIPFLGAAVAMKEMPSDAAAEARVGLAGPVLGSLACLVPLALWLQTGSAFWQALAYTGFLINLFNMLPVLPLDGGRAMSALSNKIWFVGFIALVLLAVYFHTPIFFLVLIFGAFELYNRWKNRNTPASQAFFKVPWRTRLLVGLVYIGLVGALAVGVAETYSPLSIEQATNGHHPQAQAG